VTLAYETGEAVDDLRCVLADETVLDLQAKRACGADGQLTATVSQWAAQADRLRPGDRIGLATAEPKGGVRHLGPALRRRRRQIPGEFPPREETALAAVRERVPAGTAEQTVEQVLDAAIVMNVAASTTADEGFQSAANLLEGVVVAPGSGTKAMTALQRAFQEQAAAGTGSGLDDWLQIVADAGLEVFCDADGPAGPRRRAELDAVAAYRARRASRDGILAYSLLAVGLPPMTYGPLADSIRVSAGRPGRDSEDFLHVARRWPRMLLTGLPGMGKSTALEQMAARWAADASAPVPVCVPPGDIAQRRPRSDADVTLPVLIEAATVAVPGHERVALRRALEQAAACGDAVLLLDGLDECQERRGIVADGLAAVARTLPAATGIVLATRDSGLAAALKLGLPEARLIEPGCLEETLGCLLQHAAVSLQVPEADRDRWVGERKRRLDEIRVGQPELWRVPLLATLITLLLVSRPDAGTLPASRAYLLAEAVKDTVRRWELVRLPQPARYPDLRAGQLLDGYSEIAHAVTAGAGRCSAARAEWQVAGMLTSQWGKAPAEARELAREIRRFWDEQVGVFVASPVTGDIEARSRVFAETGDAMWADRQDPGTVREWITAALADEGRREPVVLAAALSVGVAGELISAAIHETAPAARSRALLWAGDAAADSAEPGGPSRGMLLEGLAQLARDTAGRPAPSAGARRDTPQRRSRAALPGWLYVLKIAALPLLADLRPGRDSVLAGLGLDDDEKVSRARRCESRRPRRAPARAGGSRPPAPGLAGPRR
jgi:hypothetical protein